MANHIHDEARRRQMFLNRVAKTNQDMALPKDEMVTAPLGGTQKTEQTMCTDQGQFYQTRTTQSGDMRRHLPCTDVVFEKIIHDPNFYYRASKEQGLDPPLHVNEIYPIMYPGATVKANIRK